MKKRVLCTIMSITMAASLFAGCGGKDAGASNSGGDAPAAEDGASADAGADEGAAPDAGTEEAAAPDDPYAAYAGTTISVAAIETAYGSEMWQQVADAFTAETGIAVELTTDKNLEDVIGPSMQGGEYPDVIHLATGREAALTDRKSVV